MCLLVGSAGSRLVCGIYEHVVHGLSGFVVRTFATRHQNGAIFKLSELLAWLGHDRPTNTTHHNHHENRIFSVFLLCYIEQQSTTRIPLCPPLEVEENARRYNKFRIMPSSSYYDIEAILAEEELVPCTTLFEFSHLAHLDPDARTQQAYLTESSRIKIPLWAVEKWAMLGFVRLSLPRHYGRKARERLEADPGDADLR